MQNRKMAWIGSAAAVCLGTALSLLVLQEDGPMATEDFFASALVGASPGLFAAALIGMWEIAARLRRS